MVKSEDLVRKIKPFNLQTYINNQARLFRFQGQDISSFSSTFREPKLDHVTCPD